MREIETFNQEKEFQYHHVQILFTLFICMSFGLGVWVSKSDFNPTTIPIAISGKDGTTDVNPAERAKLIIPFASSAFLIAYGWFISNYLRKVKECIEIEVTQQQNKISRDNREPHRFMQEMEFLTYLDNTKYPFSELNKNEFSEPIIKLMQSQSSEVRKKIDKYKVELDARQQSVEALDKSFCFESSRSSLSILQQGIVEACNDALQLDLYKSEPSAIDFYNDVQAYLAAWLKCSIKYDIAIPIEPFFRPYLSGKANNHYQFQKSYVAAFTFIRDQIFARESIKDLFMTDKALQITIKYLNSLIEIMEHSRKTSNTSSRKTN